MQTQFVSYPIQQAYKERASHLLSWGGRCVCTVEVVQLLQLTVMRYSYTQMGYDRVACEGRDQGSTALGLTLHAHASGLQLAICSGQEGIPALTVYSGQGEVFGSPSSEASLMALAGDGTLGGVDQAWRWHQAVSLSGAQLAGSCPHAQGLTDCHVGARVGISPRSDWL